MANGFNANDPDVKDAMTGNVGGEHFNLFDDDAIEELQKQKEKMGEEYREIVKAYANVFSTEQGKKVIEDLLNRTLREAVYMPERENPEMLGHIREGQNSLVRYISQRIQQGKEQLKNKKENE